MKKSRRHILRIAALLLTLSLAVWATVRWNVWFGNVPEEPAELLLTPGHILLTFGDSNELSRNVSWQCDTVLQTSYLELAHDGDTLRIAATGEVYESRNGKAAYYVARLRGLEPATAYHYRAVTGDKASPWYAFSTHTPDCDKFSFLFVGDIQDTIGGIANRLLMQAWAHHPDVEFFVCGGDLTERPVNQYWEETFRTLDSIGQSMPVINAAGNHDYLKGMIPHLERRFPLVFSYYLDSSVEDNMVYTLTYGNAQFFVLDNNGLLLSLMAQREWLQRELQKSTATWKILVLHQPLYSIKKNRDYILRWFFDDLVMQYGVDLVLQGHEHAYARMTCHTEDGAAVTPVYIISHCSPKNYRIYFDERFDRFGISARYYQTVRVGADTLALAAYDADTHALYDSLLIIHGGNPRVVDFGKDIPEFMQYTPEPGNAKDEQFARRIREHINKNNN